MNANVPEGQNEGNRSWGASSDRHAVTLYVLGLRRRCIHYPWPAVNSYKFDETQDETASNDRRYDGETINTARTVCDSVTAA